MTPRATVVGAGVIGLTIAHELASAGHRVRVVADVPPAGTVSAVAGALWFPHSIGSDADTDAALRVSLERFRRLARDASAPVEVRRGVVVEREEEPDRSWRDVVGPVVEAPADRLPAGARSGAVLDLPVIDTGRYLDWLGRRLDGLGVERRIERVDRVDDLADECDVAVVAAGLRSAELVPDAEATVPVRGQIVRVANPGLRDWIVDDANPAGPTYVFPRFDDVVCGGTADVGAVDTAWDAEVEAAVLRCGVGLVPALAGAPVVSRAVGLRPVRSRVRLERVEGGAVPVVVCAGHGGAGVTASWGSAVAVRSLVESA